jgi:hypothetical protein
MLIDSQCCNGSGCSKIHPLRKFWNWLRRWMFLNIWCRHLYRPVMRLSHRFNWHYAPPSPLNPPYGEQPHWCQWCGLRGTTWKIDPNSPLSINHEM